MIHDTYCPIIHCNPLPEADESDDSEHYSDIDEELGHPSTLPNESYFDVDYIDEDEVENNRSSASFNRRQVGDRFSMSYDDNDHDYQYDDERSDEDITSKTYVSSKSHSDNDYNKRQESYHSYFNQSVFSLTSQVINRAQAPSPSNVCIHCGSGEALFRCNTCLTNEWFCAKCSDQHLRTAIYHRIGKASFQQLIIDNMHRSLMSN